MDNQYWITIGGNKRGPYLIRQLRSMWHLGIVNANTLYWQEGFHGWVSLSNIIDLPEPHQPDDEAALPPIVVKRKYVRPAVLAKLTVFERKQKQRLLDLRDQITDSMYGMQQDTIKNAVEGNEANGSGMHQADAGSDAYDRDFALTLLSKEANALGEIEEALQRLEMGIYGKCEVSGARIPQPRLEAMPFARLTVECQAAKEKEDSLNDYNQVAPPPLPTEPQNLHTPPPLPTLVNASRGIKCDRNVNHPRKNTKDSLGDDTLLGISSDMPTEEIRTHLNKLFRKYSGRISHDNPKIAAKARERLKKIGEARARHIGGY